MNTLIIISLIFFGLVFGSFGSVIFYRLGEWPTKETWKGFLVGRSECPKCHHKLAARNLVPIFSRLFQGGKCEYCKTPISWFYPFLEITTVIIFLFIFFILSKHGIPGHEIGLFEGYIYMIFISISAWLLWIIFLYDIKTYELHITATLFLAIITLFFTLFFGTNRLAILLGIGIFTLIFLLIYYLSKIYVKQKYKKKCGMILTLRCNYSSNFVSLVSILFTANLNICMVLFSMFIYYFQFINLITLLFSGTDNKIFIK